jgi:hypothetical protein
MKRCCSQPGLLLFLLGVTAWITPSALACPDADEVRVTVVAIHATDKDDKIDPKLAELAEKLKKKNPKWTGFRMGKQSHESVEVGKKAEFEFCKGQFAVITVRHGADEKNRVGLKVKCPCTGEISYTACCGKWFPVCTGCKAEKGECLIIAVMIEPCKDK